MKALRNNQNKTKKANTHTDVQIKLRENKILINIF